jgi:hypothetical protein
MIVHFPAEMMGFSLGRAAVHRDGRHAAIGTDHIGGNQYLMCVDTNILTNSVANGGGDNPLVGHLAMKTVRSDAPILNFPVLQLLKNAWP